MKKLFTIFTALYLMILPVSNANASGMGQITGIAVASVGVALVAACPIKSPSILVYMAGAAAYLMGEMAAAKAQKAKLKKDEEETKKLQESGRMGGETQKATIEAQIKSKEEELALAKKRSMWAMAAVAAFTVAAVTSMKEFPPIFPPLVCSGSAGMAISLPLGAGVVAAYGFVSGGGIMGALMGAVGGAVAASSMAANAFSGIGPNRSIAMGAMAGLVLLAATEASGAARKLEKDIVALKKVLAQFKSETDGSGRNSEDVTDGLNVGSIAGASGGAPGGVTLLPDGVVVSQQPSCLSSEQRISSNCSRPMTFSTPNLQFLGDQPILQQAANQTAEFANAAASGDIGKANVSAGNLANMAAKVNDILKKTREASNKNLVAQGKKPIDYDKQTQDMLKSMQSSYQKETAGKNAELAALGLDKLSLDPADADKSGVNITVASTEAAIPLPETKGDGAAVAAELAAADAEAAAARAAKKAAEVSSKDALGKNLADYETNDNDISPSKETSLWKQVSNRYLLKYERFFERKKVPAQ
jgi:hypothetical protein